MSTNKTQLIHKALTAGAFKCAAKAKVGYQISLAGAKI